VTFGGQSPKPRSGGKTRDKRLEWDAAAEVA